MAVNKSSPSQAEKAAQYVKNRRTEGRKKTEEAAKKPEPKKKDDPRFSEQGKACLVSLILFILFATMALNPEGKILQLSRDFLQGLFGKGAFIMSIFALFFLFVIFARRKSQKVKYKIRCAVAFVLLFGVLHHLLISDAVMTAEQGLGVVGGFYRQGILGESGGFICGFIGFFLRWAIGKPISVLMVLVAWLLVLLGAVDITVPRVLRAMGEMAANGDDDGDDDSSSMDGSQRVASWILEMKKNRRSAAKERMEMKQRRRMERFEERASVYNSG